jgi:methylated-DNA-[protein]-cysteine S-methyltransferase
MGVIDLLGGTAHDPSDPEARVRDGNRSAPAGGTAEPSVPPPRPDTATILLTHTPVGPLRLTATTDGLRSVSFVDGPDDLPRELSRSGSNALRARGHLRDAVSVLRGYFAGLCTNWDLKLDLEGCSDFQMAVFEALRGIPYGSLESYGELAREFGGSEHARAVGRAVGSNPIPVVIPCHRVVRNDGRLGGFSGGLERKAALLRLEGIDVESGSSSGRIIPGGLRLDL